MTFSSFAGFGRSPVNVEMVLAAEVGALAVRTEAVLANLNLAQEAAMLQLRLVAIVVVFHDYLRVDSFRNKKGYVYS